MEPQTKSIRVYGEAYDKLKAYTDKTGIKLAFAVSEAIEFWLEKKKGK